MKKSITIEGKTCSLVYDLNAMEYIQEHTGINPLAGGLEINAKNIKVILHAGIKSAGGDMSIEDVGKLRITKTVFQDLAGVIAYALGNDLESAPEGE